MFITNSLRFSLFALVATTGWLTARVDIVRAAEPNQLSPAEAKSGWELLFDGKSTNGWRNYGEQQVSPGWQVQDGVLARTGERAGDIITTRKFANFELSLEYRISPGGNSGVMFRALETAGPPWHTGPEVQIQDNVDGHDPQKAGWLYQLYRPETRSSGPAELHNARIASDGTLDATRPAGQWNHLYLRVTDKVSEVVINGLRYYRFELGSDDWKRRVSQSKFAELPEFAKAPAGHICLQDHDNPVAFRNIKVRSLDAEGAVTQQPVDERYPMRTVVAFPDLQWENWDPIDAEGKTQPQRIIELTHAHDDSGRLFAASQSGVIYVFPNDPQAKRAQVFLDLSDKVADWQRANEEGLLGLAFSPKYRDNGEFYVYYSLDGEPRRSIVSRFRVSANDPDRAELESEQVVLEVAQPFSNHNGGSIEFGPDGYLYLGLGDGGDRNDPAGHGQNLGSLLGKILRIDVERRAEGQQYSIPADNPFVQTAEARPEIYSLGWRNPWRLAFDRATQQLWAADVGQELWEEVNLVVPGGNYGWSLREGTHPFGNLVPGDGTGLIDPLWEYDHQIGFSVTGGRVYRGSRQPELTGKYLYGDYVSGRIWALEIDLAGRKVTKNVELVGGGVMPLAFGEDAAGEIYVLTAEANGQCIHRLEPQASESPVTR